MKHLVLALMLAVSASGATAQDDLTIGKKVGDRMAPSLSAADQDDKHQHLQSLAGPNELILLFSPITRLVTIL